ncbi:MAG: DUF4861 family protein [Candidatus Aminicenantales bacterium]
MRQETDTRRRPIAILVFVAAAALAAASPAAQTAGPEVLGFKKHFIVEITNPSPLTLENQAVVIDVAAIRASVAADFNTYMYALFDTKGGEYALVVSQADDLDKDRYHDEIVLVRTLPPSSTTKLACYYTPERSFQLMATQKAFARGASEAGGVEAGWESNLAAYKFVHGRIGFFGKLQPGLILKISPAALAKSKDSGMDVLDLGESAGLGGLSVWDGATRIPLFGPAAPQAKLTVISPGPVRGLLKAEYPAVKTAGGDVSLTVFFSAFADNSYSRQDVVIASKSDAPVLLGPGIQKLAGETWSLDKAKGSLAAWGKGAGKAGDVGLAAIFAPADLSGVDDAGLDHALKLAGRAGHKLTYWVAGAWERGISAPENPPAKGWARRVDDLAARLLVPVKIEFKAQ